MPSNVQSDLLHLRWRAGFGPALSDWDPQGPASRKALYARLRRDSQGSLERIQVVHSAGSGLVKGLQEAGKMEQLTREQKQELRKQRQEGLRNLNLQWMERMVSDKAQLREKMALFWHGHFACRNLNIYFQQELLHTIRENALGDFSTLLREVSKSAAMLAFLNNQQNRKQHPNENFARELLELFTLGRGHYTESDVKEAARAFTGWGFNLEGEFVFRRQLHDTGSKVFMGKQGTFDGDDILDILLGNERTAQFIAGKIFRFLVNDQEDPEIVARLSRRFYAGGYQVQSLLDDIFQSDWFYGETYIGRKIKSPVELMVGMQRMLPIQFQQPEILLRYQHLLGQVLFFPPNVAGWPGGRNWIDSSTLMHRLRLPRIWHDDADLPARPKADDDLDMGRPAEDRLTKTVDVKARKAMFHADIDWQAFARAFDRVPKASLPVVLSGTLLTTGSIDLSTLHGFTEKDSRENYIRSLTIALMSLPEYQVC